MPLVQLTCFNCGKLFEVQRHRAGTAKRCSQQCNGGNQKHGGAYSPLYRVWVGTKYLGLFHDEVEAARAYDAAARDIQGEFAHLNFPEETCQTV